MSNEQLEQIIDAPIEEYADRTAANWREYDSEGWPITVYYRQWLCYIYIRSIDGSDVIDWDAGPIKKFESGAWAKIQARSYHRPEGYPATALDAAREAIAAIDELLGGTV